MLWPRLFNFYQDINMKKGNIKSLLGLILVTLLSAQTVEAQKWFRTSSLEFGLIGGFSHYSGDLTRQTFESKGFKPSVGLITRYTPSDRFTFRLSAQYGQLEGRDDWYETPGEADNRNLSFQSDLWDFTGALEFNIRRMDPRVKSGVFPYVYAGVSVFKYNPKAVFEYDPGSAMAAYLGAPYTELANRDGELVELQPLGTEGQETTEFNDRERYSLTQIAIPVGAGLKFKLNHKWTLGLEYGMRITFTDYIDDVSSTYVDPVRLLSQYGPMSAAVADRSPTLHDEQLDNQRGDPDKNDLYGLFGVTFTYRLYGNRPSCPTF